MSLPDLPRIARLLTVLALAGLTAGCFQPLYGDRASTGLTAGGLGGISDKMRAIDVAPVVATTSARLPRVGGEIRNELIFSMTGGGEPNTTAYLLKVSIGSSNYQIVADITSGRAEVQNYGIDAYFTLTEIGTGKLLLSSTTFSRVSYDMPGQQQRFAGLRGLRDAENRAAKVIAENIRNRVASHFAGGT